MTNNYKITGKILLSFIMDNEQHDYLLDKGTIEYDGKNTLWYIDSRGIKTESITTANVLKVALKRGDITPL
jgi:hypothetical protein